MTASTVNPQTADTLAFMEALFTQGDTLLIRPVESWIEGGKKKSRVDFTGTQYLKVSEPDVAETTPRTLAIFESIARRSALQKTNTFFGVCPRFGSGGEYDRAWQIRVVRALWADIDNATVEMVIQRIMVAELPRPSIIVSSGNGVHVYWLLDQPYLIDDAGEPPRICLLYTSPSPRDGLLSRMPSSA